MTYNIHIPRSMIRAGKNNNFSTDPFSDAITAVTGVHIFAGPEGIRWPDGSFTKHSRSLNKAIKNYDSNYRYDRPVRFRVTVPD